MGKIIQEEIASMEKLTAKQKTALICRQNDELRARIHPENIASMIVQL